MMQTQQKILEAQKNQTKVEKQIIEELNFTKKTIRKNKSNPPACDRHHHRQSGDDQTIKNRGVRLEKPLEMKCKHSVFELKCDGENITWQKLNSPLTFDIDEAKNTHNVVDPARRVNGRGRRKHHLSIDDGDVDYSKPIEEIIKDELKSILSSSK